MHICRVAIIIVTLLMNYSCNLQQDFFNIYDTEAYEAYKNKEYDEAIKLLKVYLSTEEIKGEELLDIQFLFGKIYEAKDEYQKAIDSYEVVLEDRRSPFEIFLDRQIGTTDQTSLRSSASINLAKIYLREKEYKKSLEYVVKAEEKYSYFTCGTMALMKASILDSLYLENYFGLNEVEGVIKTLDGRVFLMKKEEGNFSRLCHLLEMRFSKSEISQEIKNAAKHLEVIETDSYDLYAEFQTVFFDGTISIIHSQPHMKLSDDDSEMFDPQNQKERWVSLILSSDLAKRYE